MSLNLLARAKSKFKSLLNLSSTPIVIKKDETKFLVAWRGASMKVHEEGHLRYWIISTKDTFPPRNEEEEQQLHYSIISTNDKFPKLEKHLKYPIPQGKGKDNHHPSSICNGLLLLSLPGSRGGFYTAKNLREPPGEALWNPTTGEYKILPLPLSKFDPGCMDMFRHYLGFGFDSASEDYKVIRLFEVNRVVMAELYSLRTNSWKHVSFIHHLRYPRGFGVHVNGTYYWLNLSDPGFIVSFDFATEKFASTLIRAPPIDKSNYMYYDYENLKLVEYCGLLGAVVMWDEGTKKISRILEIWVWDGSWSLESTHTVPTKVGLESLARTDEQLIFLDRFGKTRFFDCETSKLKKIHSLPTSESAHIFPLVESYVPL